MCLGGNPARVLVAVGAAVTFQLIRPTADIASAVGIGLWFQYRSVDSDFAPYPVHWSIGFSDRHGRSGVALHLPYLTLRGTVGPFDGPASTKGPPMGSPSEDLCSHVASDTHGVHGDTLDAAQYTAALGCHDVVALWTPITGIDPTLRSGSRVARAAAPEVSPDLPHVVIGAKVRHWTNDRVGKTATFAP